jgi:hypothetical protein
MSHVFAWIWPNSNRGLVNHCAMPSIGQTWVLASIGVVVEMGVLSTLKRLLMDDSLLMGMNHDVTHNYGIQKPANRASSATSHSVDEVVSRQMSGKFDGRHHNLYQSGAALKRLFWLYQRRTTYI